MNRKPNYLLKSFMFLKGKNEALNRSVDLLDIVAGTEDEPHVLLEQGIIYSFMAGDSTSTNQKLISPSSAQQLAVETYLYVLNNYSESPSAEIAAWFLGETHVSSKPGELDAPITQSFALHQNYPNPFIPTTTIRYDLPERSIVSIKRYDILGREVTTLVHNTMAAGFHELRWDGKDIQGIPVSTGMYIYRFTANTLESKNQFVKSQKMVMMK